MTSATEYAQTLIRCESVTPDEAGALACLERELGAAGFACERLRFSEPGTADVENLYARIGDGTPHICFAGHIDVVPPGDEAAWRLPPFAGEIENGVLYGRGAVDMKGAVAASLAAALEYLREKPDLVGSISFLITADEEGPSVNGTRKVVERLIARGERPDACVLGECTSEDAVADTIKIGRRGSLGAELIVRGVQGHVAYPQKARNPLPALIDALTRLKARRLDDGSEHFQPSNLEITTIDTGNKATNIIPAQASARFNIRFNDLHTAPQLKAWIEGEVAAALLDTGVEHTLNFDQPSDSFLTSPGGFVKMLGAAVKAETGREPVLSTGGGTSDARFIKDLCPVAELGLLNATAHKVDEHTATADIETLARIYKRFLHLAIG
ncbi:succinyl-diaminopimelate desuccinylase [Rhodomicrobium vannielii ATCC 17100]|uniref:succinyl-diaminopimelate desuccinylase n=1 Tax=Rhodomicrobium vannielii TaxID=1069 RepID=UPI001918281C|nr:succinyl-diaminopimelate desuccinylase [Rhodomicrobium vannielii]MBJ7535590.1 succinyl-diaminopimelate desuccinylase [Rhodomicrobium vannielii ATCC 17100]